MMKRFALIFAWVIPAAVNFSIYAQTVSTAPIVQVPPSPDAAHLGSYGEFNVSKATGSVDISIPLITLQEGGITIPISLSYQSSGLRVDDRPSWVGMGWVLSAGGVISRTMRGRHDDLSGGFLKNCTNIPVASKVATTLNLPPSPLQTALYDEFDRITKNFDSDYEPDAFSFNFPGYSGSFFFGNDGVAHCTEHEPLKIVYVRGQAAGVGNDVITGWRITDDSGIEYTFTALEFTETRFPDRVLPKYISSWYLTSIYNPITKTTAVFNYDNNVYNYTYADRTSTYSYTRRPDQSLNWTGPTLSSSSQETRHEKVKFLSSITLNGNEIQFFTSPTIEPFRRLDQIRWNNGFSQRDFTFAYDYFESECSDINNPGCARSRLLSITEDPSGDP